MPLCNIRTIQIAFTEVSNSLIAHRRLQEAREKQEALVAALEDRKRLAYARYQGGVDTQLNALDADRDLLQAKLDLRQIKFNELPSVVQLYKALGGGWDARLPKFRTWNDTEARSSSEIVAMRAGGSPC